MLELSGDKRIKRVKELKLCLNCLRSGHFLSNCRSAGCKKFQGKHNTMLHLPKYEAESDPKESSKPESNNAHTIISDSVESVTTVTNSNYSHVM